jgi:hypothetical protein
MTTLTIQIPDKDAEIVKKVLEKFKVKIISSTTPNALTQKTIIEAQKGKGLGKPIENVKAFMDSL